MRRTISILPLIIGLAGSLIMGPVHSSPPEEGDSVAFTDMDQMLFDARRAIKQGHYDVAIQTCEKILHKDAKQMTALKIMGSAYYLMNEPDRARHVWEYALQIDPEDPDIPTYLSRLPPPTDR